MAVPTQNWLAGAPRHFVLLYAGFCLFLGATTLHLSAFGQYLERAYGLELLYHLRGTLPAPAGVVMVTLSDAAARNIHLPHAPESYQRCSQVRIGPARPGDLGLPSAARLADWPRCLHAHLVERLRVLGADTIIFDVTFRTRDPYLFDGMDVRQVQDEALATAMARAGNVLLTTKIHDTLDLQSAPRAAVPTVASLSPVLYQQALGVGPFHLADTGPPYGRVYLFSDADTTRPSVLVTALMYHHRQAYEKVVRALLDAAPESAGLPSGSAQLALPGELEATALQLRQLAQRETQVVGRAAHRRNSADALMGSVMDPAARRWLAVLGAPKIMHMNFYGPPGTLEDLGFDQVLDASADTRSRPLIQGRVVFVGYAETSRPEQLDHFESYFSDDRGLHHSGVELAATAFANIQNGEPLRLLSTSAALAILAGFAFVPLAITLYRPQLPGHVFAALLAAGYVAGGWWAFQAQQLWLPVIIPVAIMLPLALLGSVGWQALRQSWRTREIEGFLGRLLPREVVERIRENAQRLRSPTEAVSGACIATDINGFSSLAEKVPSNTLVKLMDHYYSELTRVVARRNGVVSNIAGDEMIAVWANEGSDEANCESACEASLAILKTVAEFNAKRPRTPLPTRIGVHFGPLTFGSLGGQAPLGAFGDTVNTASRIQNLNKVLHTRLLVSAHRAQLPARYLTRDLGMFTLRGKQVPTRVFEVAGPATASPPGQRRLFAEFAVALAACKETSVTQGLEMFRRLLVAFPEDGPTTFYVQYIAEHPNWGGESINLEAM